MTPAFYYDLFVSSQKYKSENYTQYATRVEVDFKLYLQSRKIQDGDYKRLKQLMLHDKFTQCIPQNLQDFAIHCEMDGWQEVQPLAGKLDLYSNDRKVDNALSHSGSGPPKPRQGGYPGSGGRGKNNKPSEANTGSTGKSTKGGGQSSNSNPPK